MSRPRPRPALHRAAGPAQRWVLWVMVQALLALGLAAGPRAVSGPLHWHDAAHGHHDHGAAHALARHVHDADDGAVVLDQGAQAADTLGGGASAGAAATLWPTLPGGLVVPQPAAETWGAPHRAAAWADADLDTPSPPPRA